MNLRLTGCNSDTGSKGISLISWVTATLRRVVGHRTGGMVPTYPGTWVHTVLVYTGQVPRALCIDHTLWFTLYVGVASVIPDTGTAGSLADLVAHGINATWRRVAWLNNLHRQNGTWR